MALITISVQSLLNSAQYDSYTLDDGSLVDELKNNIQTETSVDISWFNLVFNDQVLGNDSLSAYNIVDGSVLRSANIIARLETLQERQLAKLNLSQLERQELGNSRPTYDITELPTQYVGNEVVDNPNPDGLLLGRPWIITGPTPGAFILDWYGSVSYPVATTGTYTTTNGGITLDPDSYIDVGAGLTTGPFTITLDAALGLGWNGSSWDAILGNESYFAGTGFLCYISGGTSINVGPPNQGAEGTITDITDNVRRLYTFTYDGTTMSIYENGVLVGSNEPSSYTTPDNNFYIGSRHGNDGGSGPSDSQGGTYYSVKVEPTPLDSTEVLNAYNAWAGISSVTFQSTVFGPGPYIPGFQIEDQSGSFNMPIGFTINDGSGFNSVTGSGIALINLTPEQLTFLNNSPYNNGYVWYALWGPGSTYSVTPVALYTGNFGPDTVVCWILDPTDPTYSTPVPNGTFNFPVILTEGTTPTTFQN